MQITGLWVIGFLVSLTEEDLMQQHDILIQILLRLRQNPSLKIHKIEPFIGQPIPNQPLYVVTKVRLNLLRVEYSVYHMAAEQPHFNFIF
jgi:hypothetical protein